MTSHAQAKTLSERADELEEHMMHELNNKIATKAVLYTMGDGKVEMESGPAVLARNPGKHFLMGDDSRLPKMPDEPTLIDFMKLPLRLDSPPAAERQACAQDRPAGEDRDGVPPPRHCGCRLHPRRPRLLGRADARALCRRGGELGDPHAPGAALLPRRVGRLRLPRALHQVLRRRITSPSPTSSPSTSARGTTSGT